MITDNILLPVGGILMCYFVAWKFDIMKLADEIEQGSKGFKIKKLWVNCIKYVTPILLYNSYIIGFCKYLYNNSRDKIKTCVN